MSVYYQRNYQRAFGTFPLRNDDLRAAVATALDVGYRAFDTAQMYQNESTLGEVLQASGIQRDELLITTKVQNANFDDSLFLKSVEESLRKLRVDSVDVLLLHWPPMGGDVVPSLKLLQKAHDLKLTRNIGVSNYNLRMLKQATRILDVPISTNQVEYHPLLSQGKLLAGATELGIPLSSYCSLARGKILEYPILADIGKRYGKTAGQVALQWILQRGVSTNVMSTNPENIRNNFDVLDFVLSSVDLARIDKLNRENCRIVDKHLVPWAPDWD